MWPTTRLGFVRCGRLLASGLDASSGSEAVVSGLRGPRSHLSRHKVWAADNLVVMADPEGFVPFYQAEAEAVLMFLTRRTLDGEVALELTAETFAQAWLGWPRVRTDSDEEVRAWLFTIARRQLGRYFRRGHVQRAALRRLGIQTPVAYEDDLAAIEAAAGVETFRPELAAELQLLSADQREALQLRVIEEMPYEEVAVRLGISEPTARARVSRALRTMQNSLATTWGGTR